MLKKRSKKRENKRFDRPNAQKKLGLMDALFVMDHTQKLWQTTFVNYPKRAKYFNCLLGDGDDLET